jgi:hypothetical protein
VKHWKIYNTYTFNSCNISQKRYIQDSKNSDAGLFVLKALLLSFPHILSFPNIPIIFVSYNFIVVFSLLFTMREQKSLFS